MNTDCSFRRKYSGTLIFAVLACLSSLAFGKDIDYKATVDVRGSATSDLSVTGIVFEDRNRDGKFQQQNEPGIPDVMVSNGLDVVTTDQQGRYRIPNIQPRLAPGAMTIFVTKPAGYEVPVDRDNVPQFFYHHIPAGSPPNMRGNPLRFKGLPASGSLPEEINFPLIKGDQVMRFRAAFSGDTQTYSNNEVGYMRDTLVKELSELSDLEFIMIEGDVMGDDLGLMPRFKQLMSSAGLPLYLVPGNHDIDFDAATDSNSLDTFKREWGPAYYSFDIGRVHFMVIDDIDYPCKSEANFDGLHPGCDDDILSGATYNSVIDNQQIQWIKNDLAHVPMDKLIVVNMHIPVVSFIGQFDTQRRQIDNPAEFYTAVGCKRASDGSFPPEDCSRRVLALFAHTHTMSNMRPGERYKGWATALDSGSAPPGRAVPNAPFQLIDTGALAGSWWGGDLEENGVPASWQRMGSPKGFYIFEFIGNEYIDTFKASGKPIAKQMSLSILSPTFMTWFNTLTNWWDSRPDNWAPPPVNINDLPDTSIILNTELPHTRLVANVWNGTRDSEVYVNIDDRPALDMTRTQPGDGEGIVETIDPFQLRLNLQIARYAFVSTSGNPDSQGYRQFRDLVRGPATPRPTRFGTSSNHVWMVNLPSDLSEGSHVARVTTVDVHGRKFQDTLIFEVRSERPEPHFRSELFRVKP